MGKVETIDGSYDTGGLDPAVLLLSNVKVELDDENGAHNQSEEMIDLREQELEDIGGKMKKHREENTGQRPFPCTMCEKKFKRKDHLQNHLQTHTGEKPFACTQCDKIRPERPPDGAFVDSHRRKAICLLTL